MISTSATGAVHCQQPLSPHADLASLLNAPGLRFLSTPQLLRFREYSVDCNSPSVLEAVVSHDPVPPPERPDRIPVRGRCILVVEDEGLIALMVQDALVEAGAEVTTAHTARAAIAAFAPGHFAAAVVNPGLPDLSGVDVIRQFRVSQPRLPVVVVTGSVAKFGETGSSILNGGTPTAVLEKPFELAVLVEMIADLLAATERGPCR